MKIIALAAAIVAAAAANAQVPASTPEIRASPTDPERGEIASTDAVFRDIISCVANYQQARTRNLLDTVPGSHRAAVLIRSFWSRMESCHNGERTGGFGPRFDPVLVRGAIAELYYRREFPNGITPANGIEVETIGAWTRPRLVDTPDADAEMIHAMSRCVTARQPAMVGELVASAPFSTEEMSAMRELQPDIAACLDNSVEFAVSRQSLRALLAEAALHYAEAQRFGFDRVGRGNPDLE